MYSASYDGDSSPTRIPQNYSGNYDFEHDVQDFSNAAPEKTLDGEACECTDSKSDDDAPSKDDTAPCDTPARNLTDYFSCEDLLLLGLAAYMFFAEGETDLALILAVLLLIR